MEGKGKTKGGREQRGERKSEGESIRNQGQSFLRLSHLSNIKTYTFDRSVG